MDLATIQTKLNNKDYKSRQAFCDDLELIVKNCLTYNGEDTCKKKKYVYFYWIGWFYATNKSMFGGMRGMGTNIRHSCSLYCDQSFRTIESIRVVCHRCLWAQAHTQPAVVASHRKTPILRRSATLSPTVWSARWATIIDPDIYLPF